MRDSFIVSNLAAADHIDIPMYDLVDYYAYRINYPYYTECRRFLKRGHLDFVLAVDRCREYCRNFKSIDSAKIASVIEECGHYFNHMSANPVILSEIRSLKHDSKDLFISLARIYRIMTSAKLFKEHNASISMIVISSILVNNGHGGVLYKDGGIMCTGTAGEYLYGMRDSTVAHYLDGMVDEGVDFDVAVAYVETLSKMRDSDMSAAFYEACSVAGIERNVGDVINGINQIFKDKNENQSEWQGCINKLLADNGHGHGRAASIKLAMYAYSKYF